MAVIVIGIKNNAGRRHEVIGTWVLGIRVVLHGAVFALRICEGILGLIGDDVDAKQEFLPLPPHFVIQVRDVGQLSCLNCCSCVSGNVGSIL